VSEKLKAGDKVKWKTSHGETVGEVEEKLTSPTDIKGHHVAVMVGYGRIKIRRNDERRGR
jgi:Hypervirulence associated proteins TUDOR domain